MSELWDADLCRRAAEFAAEAHAGQTMLGSDAPYLLHVTSVAFEIARAAAQPGSSLVGDLAIPCAWLHDTIEDTEATVEQLEATFGSAVTRGVEALSKKPGLTKAEALADSIDRLKDQPTSVQAVKLGDRIVNLQPPPENWSIKKRMRYAEQAELILDQLGNADAHLAQRLRGAIDHYRREHIPE